MNWEITVEMSDGKLDEVFDIEAPNKGQALFRGMAKAVEKNWKVAKVHAREKRKQQEAG